MKKRLTYVPNEIIEAMPDMAIKSFKVNNTNSDVSKLKTHQFDILSLLKLLNVAKYGPVRFSHFYKNSQIRMKKSFLNYLHFAVNHNFLSKNSFLVYGLTGNGKNLLKLFGLKVN
jgi:hypothetical protein